MQVSVESTGDIERKINVEVPAERLDKEYEKQLKSMRGRVRIDGFRPGKVPLSVVKQRYGQSILSDVASQIIQETLFEAIDQEKLKIAGRPSVTPSELNQGEDLKYFAEVEIYPEVTVADLSSIEITKPVVAIADTDVDNMIEVLRKQQQTWASADRAAKDGDKVTISFVGTLDGETFEGGSAEGFEFELGAGRMLADFETAVSGMSKDEEKTADVAFPDDYQAEELKGKTAQFVITLNDVSEPVLPEINEEFIKKFGVESGDLEGFRKDVTANMQRELDQAVAGKIKDQAMSGLFDSHDIPVPKALVENEIAIMRNEMGQRSEADMSHLPDSLFEEQAHRRVKLGLVVGEIIQTNDIKRDDERVQAMIQSLAESYEEPSAVINYYTSNPEAKQSIEAAVMEEMIVEWVLDQAKVTEESSDFDTLMASARAANGM